MVGRIYQNYRENDYEYDRDRNGHGVNGRGVNGRGVSGHVVNGRGEYARFRADDLHASGLNDRDRRESDHRANVRHGNDHDVHGQRRSNRQC